MSTDAPSSVSGRLSLCSRMIRSPPGRGAPAATVDEGSAVCYVLPRRLPTVPTVPRGTPHCGGQAGGGVKAWEGRYAFQVTVLARTILGVPSY